MLLEERDALLALAVGGSGQGEAVSEHALGPKAGLDLEQLAEALDREPGADQEHQGESDLGDHQ